MHQRHHSQTHSLRQNLHTLFLGMLLLCLALLGLYALHESLDARHQKQLAQQMALSTEPAAPSPAPAQAPAPYVSPIDFAALQAENPDAYAWVRLPGTQVDGPVLQHAQDTDYYLNHTLEGKAGLPGSIYTRNDTPQDFSGACSVLYGHNMKNGTMFGTLKRFRDDAFFADPDHRTIQIFTPEQELDYTIFAAVEYSDVLLTHAFDLDTAEGKQAFLDSLQAANGHFDAEIPVDAGEPLLVLSTCVGGGRNTVRYLVVGVLQHAAEQEKTL